MYVYAQQMMARQMEKFELTVNYANVYFFNYILLLIYVASFKFHCIFFSEILLVFGIASVKLIILLIGLKENPKRFFNYCWV